MFLNGNSISNIWALLRGPVASRGLYSQLTIANYDGKTGLVFKENVRCRFPRDSPQRLDVCLHRCNSAHAGATAPTRGQN